MDCPRCGEPLLEYVLGERTTMVCESCRYVGIPTEHHATSEENESWSEALARFREQHER